MGLVIGQKIVGYHNGETKAYGGINKKALFIVTLQKFQS